MERTSFAYPSIQISLPDETSGQHHFTFDRTFRIGRHSDCEITLQSEVVSRQHAAFCLENGQWWIQDLQSANGVFLDGRRIQRAPVTGSGRIQLGSVGPVIMFTVAPPPEPEPVAAPPVHPPSPKPPDTVPPPADATSLQEPSLSHYKAHYFGKTSAQEAGLHTLMVRRAFAEVQQKQRLMYGIIIGVVVLLLIMTGSVAFYKHSQVVRQRKLAAEIFYSMRSMEINLMKLRLETERSRSLEVKIQMEAAEAQKQKLEQSYARYVESLDVYSKGLSEEEKIILRMTRRFGECEINVPKGFAAEVADFIKYWQSTERLPNVIRRAERRGYIPLILRSLEQRELPPQFFYLAVQESNLNHRAVGPRTRFGIAKGMWQFIPVTAKKYGLRIGPLEKEAQVDPLDDRHDVEKSTLAAAQYLRDIYTTEAQASGLLVMASYNWGEHRVNDLISAMPANPQERNFWQLISKHREKIPDETYDYVFSIFSAAVIGENPRLFGFDFDNPLSKAN